MSFFTAVALGIVAIIVSAIFTAVFAYRWIAYVVVKDHELNRCDSLE